MAKRQANDELSGDERVDERVDEQTGEQVGERAGQRADQRGQPGGASPSRPAPHRLRLVVAAAVIALLAGTSASALWQRERARARLAESHAAAAPLLTWLEQAMEPPRGAGRDEPGAAGQEVAPRRQPAQLAAAVPGAGGPRLQEAARREEPAPRGEDLWLDEELTRDEALPLSAAARLARAVGGARGEAQAQGLALRALLPAERALVAEVQQATERLAQLDDAASWPTVMRAYRWLAREAGRRGDTTAQRRFLDRAVELGERCMSEAPTPRAASGLAAALAGLAELERAAGALDQSEQQWRPALALLERQLDVEQRREERAALRLQMSRALLALGDLEQERRRRAGARGYYERALASASAAGAEQRSPASRRQLLAAGLRRLAPALVEAEDEAALTLCGQLLEQLAAWMAEVEDLPDELYRLLAELLDRCPRLPPGSAAGRWIVERLSLRSAAEPIGPIEPAGTTAPAASAAASPSLRARLRAALASPVEP